MKAVNLIPVEERRGGGAGAAGRSGGGVYVLLGTLALLVVLTSAYVLSARSINDKKAELAKVEAEAQQAEAQAVQLSAYTKFASLRATREQTVTQLAATRFDWAHALREVSRVIPENAWLTNLVGTVAPDVQLEGGNGAGGSIRAQVAAPAMQVSGCTTSQSSVAKMLARMRLIDGVQRVSLVSSEKAEGQEGGGGGGDSAGGGAGSDCRYGSSHFPRFELVVFYQPKGATPSASRGAGTTGQPAANANAAPAQNGSAGTTQPATTTASGGTATTPAGGTTTTPSSTPQPASGGTTP